MTVDVNLETLIVGLVGLLAGYAIRLHEVIRYERKAAYLAYLRALDRLPHALMEAAGAESIDSPMEFAEAAAGRVAEAEAEMSITGSKRALRKVARLRAVINSPELKASINATLAGTAVMNVDDRERGQLSFLVAYWNLTGSARSDAINAMRWDLRIRKIPPAASTTPTWL